MMILAQVQMTPGNWITIGFGAVSLLGTWAVFVYAIGRFRQSVDDRFQAHGERLGSVETDCGGKSADAVALQNRCQQLEFLVNGLTKENGELRGMFEQFMSSQERRDERERSEDRSILDRLISIEKDISHITKP